jgi:hypothetical protein
VDGVKRDFAAIGNGFAENIAEIAKIPDCRGAVIDKFIRVAACLAVELRCAID